MPSFLSARLSIKRNRRRSTEKSRWDGLLDDLPLADLDPIRSSEGARSDGFHQVTVHEMQRRTVVRRVRRRKPVQQGLVEFWTPFDLAVVVRTGTAPQEAKTIMKPLGSGNNTLVLSDQVVRRLPESRVNSSGKTLSVFGDVGDVLRFDTTLYQLAGQFPGADRYVKMGSAYALEVSREVRIDPL